MTIILASAAAGCGPQITDRSERTSLPPTWEPTRVLSPTLLPTQALPTLVPASVPTSSPGPTAEASLQLESLQAITATTAWGTTTIPNGNTDYWFTILLRTTDGGENWWNVSPPLVEPLTEVIQELFFLDGEQAWIATSAERADTAVVSSTTVWRTQDGGRTWSSGKPISHPSPFGWELVFVDDQHGWLMIAGEIAAGSQSVTVFRTMNGGTDWEEISSTSIDDWPPVPGRISGACYKSYIWFRDISTGWVMGECLASGFFIQITHDGGLSWEFQDRPPPGEHPDVLNGTQCATLPPVFSSPQEGELTVVCMFDTLLIFHTYDGGETWEPPSYRRERQIGGVDFVDADNGWLFYFDAEGDSRLSITRDGGLTWSEINPNADSAIWGHTDFADSNVGWAVLYDESLEHSSLCRTLDAGVNWACVKPHLQPGAPSR